MHSHVHTLKQYKIKKRLENALNNNNHESIECYSNVDNLQFKMITKVFRAIAVSSSASSPLFNDGTKIAITWVHVINTWMWICCYLLFEIPRLYVYCAFVVVVIFWFCFVSPLSCSILFRKASIRHCNEWFRYEYQNTKSNGRTLKWSDAWQTTYKIAYSCSFRMPSPIDGCRLHRVNSINKPNNFTLFFSLK